MLEAQPDAQLVTIEKNEAMYELAKKNIDLHHQSFDITLKHGDAIDVIDELTSEDATFDFIFIDAAKAQYKKYFEAVQALTNNHAVIICDNILRSEEHTSELQSRFDLVCRLLLEKKKK